MPVPIPKVSGVTYPAWFCGYLLWISRLSDMMGRRRMVITIIRSALPRPMPCFTTLRMALHRHLQMANASMRPPLRFVWMEIMVSSRLSLFGVALPTVRCWHTIIKSEKEAGLWAAKCMNSPNSGYIMLNKERSQRLGVGSVLWKDEHRQWKKH